MTNVDKTDRFFKEYVYSNFEGCAFFPVNWALVPSEGTYPLPNFGRLIFAALLAPVLIPATIVTFVIAGCLVGIAALFHFLALAVAKLADLACPNEANPAPSPQ